MKKVYFLRGAFVISCLVLVFHRSLGFVPDHVLKIKDFKVEEVSRSAGLVFNHEQTSLTFYKNIEPWLSSLSSSVSVVDIDGDGWPDVYLNTGALNKPNKLFRNNHDGTFTDVAEKFGLADLNQDSFSVRSVFFDADNDGVPELLLQKAGSVSLFKKGANGKYQPIPFDGPDQSAYANAIQVLDINHDGLLDIVIAAAVGRGQGRIDPLPMNFVHSVSGAPTFVFENKGQSQFVLNKEWLSDKKDAFTNALGVGDLRHQQKADLWFATDYNDDQVFFQKDTFDGYTHGSETKRNVGAKSGMSSEVGYLDSDYPYIFVTQVYKSNFFTFGNTIWQYDGSSFSDHGGDFGINRCGWAWGAKFFDVNNGGHLSLYVANGFIAGDPAKSYWYKLSVLASAPQGIVSSPKYWPEMRGQDVSGHEQDCLFINEGENHFYDYAGDSSFHVDEDKLLGRGVAVIDYLNNGAQSLVVSNQNGRPYLYKITHLNSNHWVGFKLTGTKSNRDAIGAKVEIFIAGNKMIRELYPLNGYSSQSDSRLHFGLGPADKIEKVKIFWPSGKIQEKVGPIVVDAYHEIKEEI